MGRSGVLTQLRRGSFCCMNSNIFFYDAPILPNAVIEAGKDRSMALSGQNIRQEEDLSLMVPGSKIILLTGLPKNSTAL